MSFSLIKQLKIVLVLKGKRIFFSLLKQLKNVVLEGQEDIVESNKTNEIPISLEE